MNFKEAMEICDLAQSPGSLDPRGATRPSRPPGVHVELLRGETGPWAKFVLVIGDFQIRSPWSPGDEELRAKDWYTVPLTR